MAKADSIAPFPLDIDRDSFGHWLSGFADAEATFGLWMIKASDQRSTRPTAKFTIALRQDDVRSLQTIQSYWQCGTIHPECNLRPTVKNAKPVAVLSVQKSEDLACIVIPHFEKYPLRTKKKDDFEIWKRGVRLKFMVSRRRSTGTARAGVRGGITGMFSKWTISERDQFTLLADLIKKQRSYRPTWVTLHPSI